MPSAERRIQLLETAREIILRDGAGALTMSALADAVGVAKPIVYKHFKNSEEVVIEILRQYAQETVEISSKRLVGVKTVYDFLDEIIESLFDYIAKEGAIVRIITNGFSSSEKVNAYYLSVKNRARRVYRHLLLQQGVPEKQASLAAYALLEMIDLTILEFAQNNDLEDRDTLKEMVRGAVRVLVREEGARPRIPLSLLDDDDDD